MIPYIDHATSVYCTTRSYGLLVPPCIPVYYYTCLSVFWIFKKGLGRGNTHDEEGARKSFSRFIVDCIHYLSFHWLKTLELILEISATYRTDLPVFCKQIIDQSVAD